MLESLVKCGAFDFAGRDRAELFDCIDESLAAASAAHKDRAAGQVSLFDDINVASPARTPPRVTNWSEHERMSFEKELLGFYVTGHPLDAYAAQLAKGRFQSIASLRELQDRAQFRIAGAIAQVDRKFTKKDAKPFAVVWLEDLTGTLEVVVWNETYVKVANVLTPGAVVAIDGSLDTRDDAVRATAQKVQALSPDPKNGAAPIVLRFPPNTSASILRDVRDLLASSPGKRLVLLQLEQSGRPAVQIAAGQNCCIDLTPELERKLQPWLPAA